MKLLPISFLWMAVVCLPLEAISVLGAETKCIGHKGDLEHAFENSMAAFKSTYSRGAAGIEYDIYHTRDGIAIVSHNDTLTEQADSKPGGNCPLATPIKKLTFETLRANCVLKNGEDVPTLEEVLAYFSEKDFLLLTEFEDFPNRRTYRLFEKYYGAHPERLKLLGVNPIFTMFRIHAKRLTSSFWRKVKIFSTNPKFTRLNLIGYDGVDVSRIADRQIRLLQRKGKEISLWTYDTKDLVEKYAGLGVDYITTDKLSVCLDNVPSAGR